MDLKKASDKFEEREISRIDGCPWIKPTSHNRQIIGNGPSNSPNAFTANMLPHLVQLFSEILVHVALTCRELTPASLALYFSCATPSDVSVSGRDGLDVDNAASTHGWRNVTRRSLIEMTRPDVTVVQENEDTKSFVYLCSSVSLFLNIVPSCLQMSLIPLLRTQ